MSRAVARPGTQRMLAIHAREVGAYLTPGDLECYVLSHKAAYTAFPLPRALIAPAATPIAKTTIALDWLVQIVPNANKGIDAATRRGLWQVLVRWNESMCDAIVQHHRHIGRRARDPWTALDNVMMVFDDRSHYGDWLGGDETFGVERVLRAIWRRWQSMCRINAAVNNALDSDSDSDDYMQQTHVYDVNNQLMLLADVIDNVVQHAHRFDSM